MLNKEYYGFGGNSKKKSRWKKKIKNKALMQKQKSEIYKDHKWVILNRDEKNGRKQ